MDKSIIELLKCPICEFSLHYNNKKNLECLNCFKEFKNQNKIIDFRDKKKDETKGFSIKKDILISNILIKVFNKVNFFNGLFYIYESLAKKEIEEIVKLNPYLLLPNAKNYDLPLSVDQSIHGYDILNKIELYRKDFILDKFNNEMCLENGCGLGLFIEGFSKKFKKILVVDFSISFLLLAQKICAEKKIDNAYLICANSEKLPIKNNSIDFTHSNNVIEHVKHQDKMILEINRTLKKKGFLFLLSPNKNTAYFEPHFRLPFYGFFPLFIRKWYVNKFFKRDCNEVSLINLIELKKLFKLNFSGKYYFTFLPSKLKETALKSPVRKIIVYLLNNKITGKIINFLINKLFIFVMPYHVVISKKK